MGFIAVDGTVVRNLVRRAYLWSPTEVIAIQVSRGLGECIMHEYILKGLDGTNGP